LAELLMSLSGPPAGWLAQIEVLETDALRG
jgi:hypothetical protein